MGIPVTLTPAEWATVEELLTKALELPGVQRDDFLLRHCPRDSVVRAELESLLAASIGLGGFLETPVTIAFAGATADELVAGTALGPWKIRRLLARGGMGEVYDGDRADGLFQKKVAIKVLRSDAREHFSRFEEERRILAKLEHPGITRLLDGGVLAE